MDAYFRIKAPTGKNASEWARKMWDTYGFDYDTERTGNGIVIAWPDHQTAEQLKAALNEHGIKFSIFYADTDKFFGITP